MKKGTRATQFLERLGIAHEVVLYDHERKGAEFAAQATGFPLDRTIKTLVAAVDGHFVMALLPGDRQLSPKLLARHFGAKKADMADPAMAERLTGYHVGGISPFGTARPLPAVMEEALMAADLVMINGGQRGVMVKMRPDHIVTALKCTIAPLCVS